LSDLPWCAAASPGGAVGRRRGPAASPRRRLRGARRPRRPLMFSPLTRRRFVAGTVGAGALASLGDFSFLGGLPALGAAATPRTVPPSPAADPLARLIEATPRKSLLEKVAAEVRKGTSYQQLLSAVFLAGVRGIQPRPVGFKFHAVLVVNSAHLASQAASDQDRWLPLFWAIDNYKGSQARNRQEGDWRMSPPNEGQLPAAHQARQRFIEAMDGWNEEGAARAVTALARSAGANDVMELFWRYGARDFRDIGHKAIFVANGYRTLQTIGWRHAEPVLRSLAFALLQHEGGNPAQRTDARDQDYRDNVNRAIQIRQNWQAGQGAANAVTEFLATMRTAAPAECSQQAVQKLNNNVHPNCLWDALFLFAGEELMRRPNIVGLHCVTMTNALHYGFETSGNDQTRRILLLQAAAF